MCMGTSTSALPSAARGEEPPENTDEVEYHHVRAVELEDVGIGQVNLSMPGAGGYPYR